MTRRPQLPLESLSEDTQKIYDVLNDGSDLAITLIGANYLDQCLGSTLSRRLRSGDVTRGLLSHTGALGSYQARVDLSYALGAINVVTYKDLRTIGKIRNTFAHSYLSRSFDEREISSLCAELQYLKAMGGENGPKVFRDAHLVPRNNFSLTVAMIGGDLMLAGLSAKPLHETT